ncbi:MAG: hypothetical protein PHF00_14085 [Elusimicrobia bacterium]|nr:hypothetical protein [Elusimicrobiota bacterium]
MSRIIAAILALLLPASAQTRKPRRRPVVPVANAADKQDFEQTFEFVARQAGVSYLEKRDMPDPAALDVFIAALKEPDRKTAAERRDRFEAAVERAECVQRGRGAVAPEVYALMVSRVADELEIGAIVEERFAPTRQKYPLSQEDKALSRACQTEARDEVKDRRAAYRRCLGRRRALQAYLDASVTAGEGMSPIADEKCSAFAAQARLGRSLLPADISAALSAKLAQTRRQLMGEPSALGDADAVAASPDARPPQARLNIYPRPESHGEIPTETAKLGEGLQIADPPLEKINLESGAHLARLIKNREIGFTGYCYAHVKAALQSVGIVDKKSIADAGAARHAKLFAGFVDKNPSLLKRKLRRVKDPSWPLPIGTIVVWDVGVCGYSARSGHIEIITRIKPPQACSDGCGPFQVSCLAWLSDDQQRAAAEKPAAQRAAAETRVAYEASKTRSRLAALKRGEKALAAVDRRLQPRVAAYVIER